MGQHLVINELVGFRRLNDIVQHEHAAKALVGKYQNLLKGRLAFVQDLLDFECLPGRGVEVLVEPVKGRGPA